MFRHWMTVGWSGLHGGWGLNVQAMVGCLGEKKARLAVRPGGQVGGVRLVR